MIDTHCHLTFPDYEGRIDATLDGAERAGVTGVITIATTGKDAERALAIAERDPRVWCSAGVHPLYANAGGHDWDAVACVARAERCVAWGELGLDRHYAEPDFDLQRRVLDAQLALIADHERSPARGEAGKPVVLHCREAFAELIPILEATGLPPRRFVFHCFTGGPADMERVLAFGASVSFTGVLTYKNAREVRDAAALAPTERIMAETDAPFLSPQAVRKVRPNEPRFVVHVAEQLAHVHGLALEDMHARLNENTERFFGVPAPSAAPLDLAAATA